MDKPVSPAFILPQVVCRLISCQDQKFFSHCTYRFHYLRRSNIRALWWPDVFACSFSVILRNAMYSIEIFKMRYTWFWGRLTFAILSDYLINTFMGDRLAQHLKHINIRNAYAALDASSKSIQVLFACKYLALPLLGYWRYPSVFA